MNTLLERLQERFPHHTLAVKVWPERLVHGIAVDGEDSGVLWPFEALQDLRARKGQGVEEQLLKEQLLDQLTQGLALYCQRREIG